jgi:hypothetical protein
VAPRINLVPVRALVELARVRPVTTGAVRGIKGHAPIAKTRAAEIVAGLETAERPTAPLERPS